jgi:hypothetical protein
MIPAALVGIHSTRAPSDAAMDDAEFGLAVHPDRSSHGCGTGLHLRSSSPHEAPDKARDEGSKQGWLVVDMEHDWMKVFAPNPEATLRGSSAVLSGPVRKDS